jgi:polysaccharide export outer membrane protein
LDALAANLPEQSVGPNDLLSIVIYDAPQLSQKVRVSSDGYVKLPMLPSRLRVFGKLPVEVEVLVADALIKEELLVNPVVTVGISEYHSRPINVSGAVRNPLTFQAVGPTNLLDALGKAGGISDNAGSEVLVTSASASGENPNVRRIAIKELLSAARSELNVSLSGGEKISVPSAGRVFVLGNVKRPGAFPLREASEGTVLQMLALAEGLTMFSTKEAYIYRIGQNGSRTEVAVQLESILRRKASDIAVFPDDILYIPDNKNRRLSMAALERILMFGSTAGATALIYSGNR